MLNKKSCFIPLLLVLCCLLLCGCTSNISFNSGELPADTESAALVIQADEIEKLSSFENLKSLDLSGSVCYEEILQWAQENPDIDLLYTLELPGGIVCDNHCAELDLSKLTAEELTEALPLLGYLPELSSVNLGGAFEAQDIVAAVSAYPEIDFSYSFTLYGLSCDKNTKTLDLSGLGHSTVSELLAWLPCMPELEFIDLGDDRKESDNLEWADIAAIKAASPDLALDYDFRLYGVNRGFSLAGDTLDLNHVKVEDNGDLALLVAKCMSNLQTLDMDFCGVGDERMAEIRDALPGVNVVWRIWFGTAYSVRTDVERILASNPGLGGELTKENTVSLKYCTKVKYLDLGHNSFLSDLSFLSYMPDLEVLIVAMANWSDISPIADCPKLEYAEIQTSALNDLRPLAGLKNLRHLNICFCFALYDLSPIYELELERLWIGCYTPIPAEQVEIMQQKHPDCVINTTIVSPTDAEWRYLPDDGDGITEYDPRYALLRQQMGYQPYNYAYYWMDPLYYSHN